MRIAIASLFAFAFIGCGSGTAEDKKPPADWTHKELVEHLEKKGLKFTTKRAVGSGSNPAMELTFSKTEYVGTELFSSDKAAKEFAAASPVDSFSWGRFVFFSNKASADSLAKVKAALK